MRAVTLGRDGGYRPRTRDVVVVALAAYGVAVLIIGCGTLASRRLVTLASRRRTRRRDGGVTSRPEAGVPQSGMELIAEDPAARRQGLATAG